MFLCNSQAAHWQTTEIFKPNGCLISWEEEMYKKVEIGTYNPVGSWRDANPYTTAFCRTMYSGNVMVCGGYHDVMSYLEKLGPCLASIRFWNKGKTRGTIFLKNVPIGMYFSHADSKLGHSNKGWDILLFVPGRAYTVLAHYSHIPSTFPRVLASLIV
jgi:hypothetical protein